MSYDDDVLYRRNAIPLRDAGSLCVYALEFVRDALSEATSHAARSAQRVTVDETEADGVAYAAISKYCDSGRVVPLMPLVASARDIVVRTRQMLKHATNGGTRSVPGVQCDDDDDDARPASGKKRAHAQGGGGGARQPPDDYFRALEHLWRKAVRLRRNAGLQMDVCDDDDDDDDDDAITRRRRHRDDDEDDDDEGTSADADFIVADTRDASAYRGDRKRRRVVGRGDDDDNDDDDDKTSHDSDYVASGSGDEESDTVDENCEIEESDREVCLSDDDDDDDDDDDNDDLHEEADVHSSRAAHANSAPFGNVRYAQRHNSDRYERPTVHPLPSPQTSRPAEAPPAERVVTLTDDEDDFSLSLAHA